ncbi:glycosyltransferase family 2 protein [Ornithinimicrobium sp. W1665]
MVEKYCGSNLVGDVIIINNAPQSLVFQSPKVRVLQQDDNIYVNPAWNLGVESAHHDLLLLSNDDIDFSEGMLEWAHHVLTLPFVGIVGPAEKALNSGRTGMLWFTPARVRTTGYGVWMAMRKASYVHVPDDLLIWGGDDWLFYRQDWRLNLHLHGGRITTKMSETVNSEERFMGLAAEDHRRYLENHSQIERNYRRYHPIYWLLNRTTKIHRPSG